MTKIVNGMTVVYKKVSGWNDGPLKPTVTNTTGTADLQTAVTAALNGIATMTDGENIHIIVNVKEVT